MIKTLDGKEIADYAELKRTERILKICDVCKSQSQPQWRHAEASRAKQKKDLCGPCARSRNHQGIKTRFGRKLKHGKADDYVMVWDDRYNRYVCEHQLTMEDATGFQIIGSGQIIHHINGIKYDNELTNLCAVSNNKQHRQVHGQLEKVAFDLVQRGVILFDHSRGQYFINPSVKATTMPISLGFEDIAIRQKKAIVTSRSHIQVSCEIIRGITLDIPFIASNMSTVTNEEFCILLEKLGSLGVLHRAAPDDQLCEWTKNISKINNNVAVSVGTGVSQFKLAQTLIRNGANIIFIDVAHGYCDPVIDIGCKIKKFASDVKIVLGNTTHPGLFQEAAEIADAIKVGIAQGFACETKNTAGVTEKQFSAIQRCSLASQTYGVPIISDGGVREPADLVKAIAAGASCVMSGKVFAACPESAAPMDVDSGRKIYAGMASRYVQNKWHGHVKNDAPEGGVRMLPLGESAESLLKRYAGALKSGISYAGAKDIESLKNNVEFIYCGH